MNAPIDDGGAVTDAMVEQIIDRVARENSADGMDGDSWDRLLVRAALAAQGQGAAVAFTVVDPTGKSSIGGWMDYRHFHVIQQMAVLREGHSYAFAYAAQPMLAAREAQS